MHMTTERHLHTAHTYPLSYLRSTMDRPVREKKPTEHYDPAKEAAKPQWQKPKKPEIKGPVHTYFISSDEDEPEP